MRIPKWLYLILNDEPMTLMIAVAIVVVIVRWREATGWVIENWGGMLIMIALIIAGGLMATLMEKQCSRSHRTRIRFWPKKGDTD